MESAPRQAPAERKLVQRYGPGRFTINGVQHAGSLLVFPDHVVAWPVTAMAELTLASLAPVMAARPAVEILLVGTGAAMALLPAPLRSALRAAGVVADVMDTGAACRTYNVLVAEDRRVAAALIMLPPA